jgi:hypothetical protein
VCEPLFVPNTKIFDTPHLKNLSRIFSIISKFGLLPGKGSYNILEEEDLIIIHHLLNGQKPKLPYIILHYMANVNQVTENFVSLMAWF